MLKKYYGYIACFISVFIWGSAYIIKEVALKYISTYEIVFYSITISTIILFIYILLKGKELKVNIQNLKYIMLSGFCGIGGCQIFNNIGINHVGGVISSVIFATVPIMCLFIDIIIYKKKQTKTIYISIVMSLFGVLIVILSQNKIQFNLLGYIYLLISNALWIIYCYMQNKIHNYADKAVILFYQLLTSAIVGYVFCIINGGNIKNIFIEEVAFSVIFLGIANSLIAIYLFSYAINNIGITRANIINNFMPIVSFFISIIIFKSEFSILQIVGVVMVIISVILAVLSKKEV